MQFTVGLIGDTGVGKTTFMVRHVVGEFIKERYPIRRQNFRMLWHTNHGPIRVKVKENSTEDIDALLVMFDLTKPLMKERLISYAEQAHGKPLVVMGTRCDKKSALDQEEEVFKFVQSRGWTYYTVSAKSNYNFEKPFVAVLSKLLGKPVAFIESPARTPPCLKIT